MESVDVPPSTMSGSTPLSIAVRAARPFGQSVRPVPACGDSCFVTLIDLCIDADLAERVAGRETTKATTDNRRTEA